MIMHLYKSWTMECEPLITHDGVDSRAKGWIEDQFEETWKREIRKHHRKKEVFTSAEFSQSDSTDAFWLKIDGRDCLTEAAAWHDMRCGRGNRPHTALCEESARKLQHPAPPFLEACPELARQR
jgi:hypothetical protein